MAVQVIQPEKKPDFASQSGGLIGQGVGFAYGGAGGASAGGAVGGAAGQGFSTQGPQTQTISAPQAAPAMQQSSPLSRRQQAIESDPATQMRQGKIALNSMDDQTRKAFEPVLDEGLRRAAEDRKKQQYGATGSF